MILLSFVICYKYIKNNPQIYLSMAITFRCHIFLVFVYLIEMMFVFRGHLLTECRKKNITLSLDQAFRMQTLLGIYVRRL